MKSKIILIYLIIFNLNYSFSQNSLGIKPISIGINNWFKTEKIANTDDVSKNYTLAFSKLYDSLSTYYQVKYYPNFQNKIKQNVDLNVEIIISSNGFGMYYLDFHLMDVKANSFISNSTISIQQDLSKKTQQEIINEYAWQVHNWLSTYTMPLISLLKPKQLEKPDYKIGINNFFKAENPKNKVIAEKLTNLTNNFLVSRQKKPDRDSIITWTNYEYLPLYLSKTKNVDLDLNVSGLLTEIDNKLLLTISFTAKKELSYTTYGEETIQQTFYLDKNRVMNEDFTDIAFLLKTSLFGLLSANFNKRDLMNLRHFEVSPPPTKP